jgi:carbamate kinase
MRILIALGGNALLRRGEPMTAEVQRKNVRIAAAAIAPVAASNELVITHGNGPQVGLLALQGAAYEPEEDFPLDVLGAQTEGMIGYLIEQELGNLLPFEVPFATLLSMVEVDSKDPAFQNPTKFVGPVYEKAEADRIAAQKGWAFKQDGAKWRRVVPSPAPKRIFEVRPVKWLLEQGTVVICAGGGGIPVIRRGDGSLTGIEAVIDKDHASALLAREIGADALLMLTDVDGVQEGFGTPTARRIPRLTAAEAAQMTLPAGSMGPKVAAGLDFAAQAGRLAGIGRMEDALAILGGAAGTVISG